MDTLAPNAATLRDLALDAIEDHGGLRRADPGLAAHQALTATIRAVGIIHPVIVRPIPGSAAFAIVDGRRRLRAAQDAGLIAIPAIVRADLADADAAALDAAANTVRAALTPVDTWRAVTRLQEMGWTLAAAAEAMGLGDRMARRMDQLGRLHPDVITAIEQHGLPDDRHLAALAQATPDAQAAALAKHAKGGRMDWWGLTTALRQDRIPKARAIFDADASGLAWEEDLFAEPGSADQWTTLDVAGFLAAQRAELEARVAASAGTLALADEQYGRPKTPRGAAARWDWKFGDALNPGEVGLVCVNRIGEIGAVAIAQPAAGADVPDDDEEEDEDPGDDGARLRARAPAEPDRFTEKGLRMLAEMRTAAIRSALRDRAPPPAGTLLGLLLVALGQPGQRVVTHGRAFDGFDDIAAAAQRALRHDPGAIPRLAAEALATMVICDPRPDEWDGGGVPAEVIGAILDAQACLPRQDTAAVLAEAKAPALASMCDGLGIAAPADEAGMRKALEGRFGDAMVFKEGDFHDTTIEFEPGPMSALLRDPAACAHRAATDACDYCGWRAEDGGGGEPCDLALWEAELSRLGLTPADVEVNDLGMAKLRPPAALDVVTLAEPAPPPQDPPPRAACAWPGTTPCREDGTTLCERCPRHAAYLAWRGTTAGKAALRAQQNAEAKASLKRTRGKKGTADG